MGVQKKTRKFAQTKRVIGQRDARLKKNIVAEAEKQREKKTKGDGVIREVPQMPSSMFFHHNTALQPPYRVLVDTNFLSHTVVAVPEEERKVAAEVVVASLVAVVADEAEEEAVVWVAVERSVANQEHLTMGVQKKTRKFAQTKRVIGQRDARLKKNIVAEAEKQREKKTKGDGVIREVPQMPSSMFFHHNTALQPPYRVLVDTNFLSHTVHHKLPLLPTLMDTLYATCIPTITSCVMAELEKLGPKYRIALQIARDERWERLECDHKGTYADDCIVDRVMKQRVYLVATNDRDLKRRVRKVPGVPIVSVARAKYVIERLPDAPEK
ncbi:hypothetical protein B0A55_03082 [Friedmanniomyces simplex]|uniref:PIN domain-containing protein n=1 Tax=Friedmanniomyces simplex TaxID=329884 RepID=A0A4U0XJ26_9PEZI|nr:hypothetical protein B0A55_03082 [Friedmanniomyces simplex]